MSKVYKNIVFAVVLVWLLPISGVAQGAFVSSFNVEVRDGKAYLRWTLHAGNTCNGISILRSIDTFDYKPVGEIFGVCGSTDTAQTFLFTDDKPVANKTNYYKLRFGYQGETAVASVFLISPNTLLLSSNPVSNSFTMRYANKHRELASAVLYDLSGRQVANDMSKGELLHIDVSGLPNGIYIYSFQNGNHMSVGRVTVLN